MMNLSFLINAVQGQCTHRDVTISGVSTDTRTIQPGDVFFALKGPNFNGHDFIAIAQDRGARAVVVSEPVETTCAVVQVADTGIALTQLAIAWRDQFQLPVVAITGSCGKTTVRALMASVLSQAGETLATQKSFNNEIGVPLTILRLRSDHQYAVIEIGANHPGEIASLVSWVKPTIAILTNAKPAHLEGFGSLEGVASAKSEIFTGFVNEQGTAVINADDAFAPQWKQRALPHSILTFGIKNHADIMAKDIKLNDEGCPHFTILGLVKPVAMTLPLLGEHNVLNALAVVAAAKALGLEDDAIVRGLEMSEPEAHRLVIHKIKDNVRVIDDTYNANPGSVEAALRLLASQPGTRIAVLADMLELGEYTDHWHSEIGKKAREFGIDYLYAYGSKASIAAKAFGAKAGIFNNRDALVSVLKEQLASNVTVLIKGSRSMKMDQVVHDLVG